MLERIYSGVHAYQQRQFDSINYLAETTLGERVAATRLLGGKRRFAPRLAARSAFRSIPSHGVLFGSWPSPISRALAPNGFSIEPRFPGRAL